MSTAFIFGTLFAGLVTSAPAAPPNGFGANFVFPLANGFPNTSASALPTTEQQAGGPLPNGGVPPNPGPGGILDLQAIVVNELAEVAFFTELLHNVTNRLPGYEILDGDEHQYIVDSLTAIKAQEQLHAIGVNSQLAAYGQEEIEPCAYTFALTDLDSALAFADSFTELVLGTLQGVEQDLASDQNPAFAGALGAVIGNEAQQDGWFRYALGKKPSSSAFLTAASGIFNFNNLMQNFIVPGSCPQTVNVPILGALKVESSVGADSTSITFSVDISSGSVDSTTDYITYISGQSLPVTVPIASTSTDGTYMTLGASFPFSDGFSDGLTIAAITTSAGPFSNASDVASNASFGPALIIID